MEQELLTNPEDLRLSPFFLSSLMTYLRVSMEQELLINPEDLRLPPFFLSSLMTYLRLCTEQELLNNPEDLSSPPFFLSSLMTYLRLCTEQELLTNPEDLSSPPFIYEVRVAQSTVLCVVFWRPLFVLLYFSFGHCIVCPLVLFFWPLYCLALHRQRNKHFNLIVRNCKSLGIKTEYMQRAVVRLVNMISCLAYD